MKLAESLSPITKRLDEVKESTRELGEVVKETNTPQLATESTHKALPIEKEKIHPGVKYDTSLGNTLNNMKDNTGSFKTKHTSESGCMLNIHPITILR